MTADGPKAKCRDVRSRAAVGGEADIRWSTCSNRLYEYVPYSLPSSAVPQLPAMAQAEYRHLPPSPVDSFVRPGLLSERLFEPTAIWR